MSVHLKLALVVMTLVAVVCDSMLMPFYPQFFAVAFGGVSAEHVGAYIAATCFTVMLAFPTWARAAKRIEPLQLLVYTQLAAGLLSIRCYWSASLIEFWLVSLLMFAFKGSYLLIYPYLMSLEDKQKHTGTIGVLSVIVHFGGILGALLGGVVFELTDPRAVFLLMASGDFLQTAICLLLLRQRAVETRAAPPPEPAVEHANARLPKGFIYKLGLIMFVFYFSVFLIRPFFALYWESISGLDNKIISGFVFAIPAVAALLAVWITRNAPARASPYSGIVGPVLLGLAGVFLQASEREAVVLIGRCIFGWALFHSAVRLDLLLFEVSPRQSYATDFSKINFFQQFGVLASSFAAGALVAAHGLRVPFIAAVCGLLVTILCYCSLFRAELKSAKRAALGST